MEMVKNLETGALGGKGKSLFFVLLFFLIFYGILEKGVLSFYWTPGMCDYNHKQAN